jgi:hypothetical protein
MTTNLYQYSHVEDYIEVIAGFKSPAGKTTYSIFQSPEPLLSLARYDVKMLESLSEQTLSRGVGYTDKQAKLALDIVIKYERQLFKHNISIEPVKTNPQYRIPIRNIDRTTRVWVENDLVCLRFPYNVQLVEQLRAQNKETRGTLKFDREKRIWVGDLTEDIVNWAYTFAIQNNFAIDSSVSDLMNQILQTEQTPYKIELQANHDTLYISNGADSLIDYVDQNLGGFSTDNLLTLVDYSAILGYTVEPVIEEVVIQAYSSRFWSLCTNRELKVDVSEKYGDQIAEIVNYAKVSNRFPIYVYEPDQTNRLAMLLIRHFNKDEVANLDSGEITDTTKLAYFTRMPKAGIRRIPLLVSGAGMIFGGERAVWLQQAEKVVYFTKDVYTKNNKKGREVCKLT